MYCAVAVAAGVIGPRVALATRSVNKGFTAVGVVSSVVGKTCDDLLE